MQLLRSAPAPVGTLSPADARHLSSFDHLAPASAVTPVSEVRHG